MSTTTTGPDLPSLLSSLHETLTTHDYQSSLQLLSRAKLALLSQNALIPTPQTPARLVPLARAILESGALVSIRVQDPEAFTRYWNQLQPFYDHEILSAATNTTATTTSSTPSQPNTSSSQTLQPQTESQRSKITGLYLLLLLSQGDYAGFHTLLEGLVERESTSSLSSSSSSSPPTTANGFKTVESDPYIRYPIELERSLMEGSYDKVWRETKSERVPSEEFGIFSNVLIHTIRSEIASCSEKAYPSLPVSNAKNLLFLDSDGAVLEFAQSRNWIVRDDGRIYFPQVVEGPDGEKVAAAGLGGAGEKEILVASGMVIENTIGYARELETIV